MLDDEPGSLLPIERRRGILVSPRSTFAYAPGEHAREPPPMRRTPLALLPALLLLGGPLHAEGGAFAYVAPRYATLDPAHVAGPNDERLVLALFDGLTAIDPASGAPVALAAERWEEAPDGRSWTFHLRAGTWSDGSPVTADDFVQSWKRVVDPFTGSPWRGLLRPLRGVAQLAAADRELTAFGSALSGLRELLEQNPGGIPGERLKAVVEGSGLPAVAAGIEDPDLKRMLRWGTDAFPADRAKAVLDGLRDRRRGAKARVDEAMTGWGKTHGAIAEGTATLKVLLDARTPGLPALLARAPFVPLHPRTRRGGDMAFAPSSFLSNGAFRVKGRGPSPRDEVPNPESVVHLERWAEYAGPRKAASAEVLCYTGLSNADVKRRLAAGEVRWLSEPPPSLLALLGEAAARVVRPGHATLVLQVRADRPPFDDEAVRRAVAAGLDRAAVAKALRPSGRPATRLLPESVSTGEPSAPTPGPREDPAAARKALAEKGLAGEAFPWVDLRYPELDGLDDLAAGVQKGLQKALGIELGLRIETPDEQRRVLAAGAYELSLRFVEPGAADADAWLRSFGAGGEAGAGFADPRLEALLAAAADVEAATKDPAALVAAFPDLAPRLEAAHAPDAREALRRELLVRAESRLLESAVVIPLAWPDRVEVGAVPALGAEAAWRRPGFAGDLRAAR
jgi:ABC-type oligopeptide transport system substrate-binding subunit